MYLDTDGALALQVASDLLPFFTVMALGVTCVWIGFVMLKPSIPEAAEPKNKKMKDLAQKRKASLMFKIRSWITRHRKREKKMSKGDRGRIVDRLAADAIDKAVEDLAIKGLISREESRQLLQRVGVRTRLWDLLPRYTPPIYTPEQVKKRIKDRRATEDKTPVPLPDGTAKVAPKSVLLNILAKAVKRQAA